MIRKGFIEARACPAVRSGFQELGLRLSLAGTLFLVLNVAVLLAFSHVDSANGVLVFIATLATLGLTSLTCATFRGLRAGSSGRRVLLEPTSEGLRCGALWGKRAMSAGDLLGAYVPESPDDDKILLTLRSGKAWLLVFGNKHDAEAARSALGLHQAFSGCVRATVRSKPDIVKLSNFVMPLLVVVWAYETLQRTSFGWGSWMFLWSFATVLLSPISFIRALLDAGVYETIDITAGKVCTDRMLDEQILSLHGLAALDGSIDVKTDRRDGVRLFDAELSNVRLMPLILRCVDAAREEKCIYRSPSLANS